MHSVFSRICLSHMNPIVLSRQLGCRMAVIYLVAWEGSSSERTLPALRDSVAGIIEQRYDARQEPGLDNMRFVFTGDSGEAIVAHIRAQLGDAVRLLVSQVDLASLEGFLSKSTWRWIDARIGRLVPATEI
jgi:hypothetical protein